MKEEMNLIAPHMLDRVMGRTRFTADLAFSDMLHGKLLLCRYPRGRIVRLDTRIAETLPGIVEVITARDTQALGLFGPTVKDQPVLVGPGDEVRFVGDALALVVARTTQEATAALDKVEFELEPLPGVWEAESALEANAPRVHSGIASNICESIEYAKGDTDAAWRAAAVKIRKRIATPPQEHAYLETEAVVAYLEDRRLVLYTCTQDPHYLQAELAHVFGLPISQVRVIGMPLGGAFGGKQDVTIQIAAALAAMRTEKPVKMVLTREESFILHPKRHAALLDVGIAATAGGELLALDADILTDAGAYTGRSPRVLKFLCHCLPGPYRWRAVRVRGRSAFTNNPTSGAFRGYGAPQAALAREVVIDCLARELDIDPIDLRRRNFLSWGDEAGSPLVVIDESVSMPQVLDAALDVAGGLPSPNPDHDNTFGRGFCCDMTLFDVTGFTGGTAAELAAAGVALEIFRDGSVTVYCSGTELGQGLTTVLMLGTAEALGLEMHDVSVLLSDTDRTPRTGITSASRLTHVTSRALASAAAELKQKVLKRASQELGIEPDQLKLHSGRVCARSDEKTGLPLATIANLCYEEGITLRAEGWIRERHGHYGHSFSAAVVDVKVNQRTGEAHVLRAVCAQDAGRAVNRPGVLAQLTGAALQGISWVMGERWVTEKGILTTPSLSEYAVPTALDLPDVVIPVIVESQPCGGVAAVKGLGEGALNATAAATFSALSRTLGRLVFPLPATAERIWEAEAAGTYDSATETDSAARHD